jgi:transposase-like protein
VDVPVPGDRQKVARVDFLFSPTRNLKDAKRFFCRAYERHGLPVQVTIDGSQTNLEAARKCHAEARMRNRPDTKPIKVRQSRYMNNRIEQDHRRIKRRIRPMLGFKSERTAAVILGGIELVHMIRKDQMTGPNARDPSLADQFDRLAA